MNARTHDITAWLGSCISSSGWMHRMTHLDCHLRVGLLEKHLYHSPEVSLSQITKDLEVTRNKFVLLEREKRSKFVQVI